MNREKRMLALAAALFLAVSWPGAAAAAELSSVPREDTWVTDGVVGAIVTTPTTIYIGGSFTHVGPCTGGGAPIDTGTGTLVAANLRVHGAVYASIPDGTGGWYIGGAFTQVGTVMRSNIAHILSNGTVDYAWDPNANNTVNALAVSGATVCAGGSFTTIGGQTRNKIAALDATTGLATDWNPNASSYVYALAVSGTTVYAGGDFSSIGGQARNHLAAIDVTTGQAMDWNPNAGGGDVLALAVSGTTVYAGGEFTTIGGQTRGRIAALDAMTGSPTAWNPNADTTVRALVVSGTTVYAGGDFLYIGGHSRVYIAALDAATGLATAWDPNVTDLGGVVYALAVSGSTVYAGGDFKYIGGGRRRNIAALNATTGMATAWNPGVGGDGVRALAVSGSTVYAGGEFATIGGQTRNHIAALDATTGAATAWNPSANSTVCALAVSGTTVYAGGYFGHIGGQVRSCIAALNTATGQATAWDPDAWGGMGAYPSVNALAVSGTTVYAGGNFDRIGFFARNGIAAINTTTGTATSWDPNVGGTNPHYPEYSPVCALAVSGTTVYAGGYFTTIGGQTRNHIAAIDATTGIPTAWNPNASSPYTDPYTNVRTLAVSGTTIYAGGGFTTIGGQTRYSIAALNATTGLATTWSPGADGVVDALAVSGTTVYAGGAFKSIGGQARLYIASLNNSTGAATTWNPNPGSGYPDPLRISKPIYAFAVSGTTVYAGGDFVTIGGSGRPFFAEFRNVTAAPAAPGNPGATLIGTNKITWTWADNSSDETGFKVYDDPGAGPPTTLRTTTPPGIAAVTRTGLGTNTQYAFRVAATNVIGDSAKTANFTAWTLAAVPAAPVVGNPTGSTLNAAIAADTNPAGTLYAIQVAPAVGGSTWVQPDGSVGATSAYQPAATWGAKTVTGLSQYTTYTFTATACNGAGVVTAAGAGASLRTLGNMAPVVTLTGANPQVVERCAAYTELGASVTDQEDGGPANWPDPLPGGAWTIDAGSVNMQVVGAYTVTYSYTDSGNSSGVRLTSNTATRTVNVVDTIPPVIELIGPSPVTVECGATYTDAGATATDTCAGNLTASIVTANTVNTAVVGVYTVTYNVSDGVNSAAEVTRVVTVVQTDFTPPTITTCAANRTMAADASCAVVVPNLTTEVVATDDTTPSGSLVITQSPVAGSVVTGLGAHMVTITVRDAAGNEQTCTASLTLTAFSENGTTPTVVPWATNGTVTALVAYTDTLYVGGSFTWAGAAGGSGTGWTNLAAVSLATGAVQAWAPVATGAVTALALSADGAMLYAGGNGFVDEVVVATGASALLTAPTGPVAGLAVSGGVLYIGGNFTTPTHYIQAYDLVADAPVVGWTAALSEPVLSLAASGTTLYAGEANGIETVDLTTGTVAVFSASAGSVNSLWANCSTVYAGGLFGTIGGQTRDYVAALDAADGTAKTGWTPLPNSAVRALAVTSSSLYAAGDFTAIDGYGFAGLVKFTNTAAPTVTVNQAAGQADPATAYPINFTVVFSEAVTGFDAADVTWGGTASGVVSSVSGSGQNYTISVTASNNQGTLVPSIAAGRCISADGVYNAASTSTDNSVTVSVRSISVTSPTAGMIWGQGEAKSITWTNTGTMTGNVSIFLTKTGVADKWLADAAVSAGTVSYTLSTSQAPGTGYGVKVLWSTNNAIYGTSASFTVEARTYFTCTWPTGSGQTWVQGESKTVTWTQTGLTGNVAVYLAKDGLANRWLAQGPFSALQLAVTLPFTVATGSGYSIKLVSCSNATISAVGANTFSVTQGVPFVVTYPATDGVVWPQGEVRTITWVNHGLTGAVGIYLAKTGQADRWIAQPLATAQSVDITLPFTSLAAGTGYTVKMIYVTNTALAAVGTNTITVEARSPVTVNYPAGGTNQAFILGSTLRVSWLSTSLTSGNMAVYLTKPGMADRWIGQPLATAGFVDAVIPANLAGGPGNDYKAKVVYTLNNAWTSTSTSTFCILATPAVSAPAAGASWKTPSTGKTVTWNMTSLPGNIAVYLTKPGMADRWVGQTLASAGTVNVNVPSGLTAGSDYKIKAVWANNNAINASSGAIQITP